MNFYIGNSIDEINPYVDVEISKNVLSQVIEVCNYILDASLLQAYEEPDEGKLYFYPCFS